MSVQTTADENLNSIREHINESIKDLGDIVVDQCWGHDEFNEDFLKDLRKTFNSLLDICDTLNR